MKRRNWTREELIMVFNLYCQIEFSKINYKHPLVQQLSETLNRTPSAIAWKLVNFASLDLELTEKGIKGAVNCSKLDREIFNEFTNNWNDFVEESEVLLIKHNFLNENHKKEGKDTLRTVKTRTNQSFFRKAVLSAYNTTCCVTGIDTPELLIASHIIPWAKDEKNRLNPKNGLCLNNLHDKAFDKGLITFDKNYRLIISSELKIKNYNYFMNFNQQKIQLPKKFLPDLSFIEYHNQEIFRG